MENKAAIAEEPQTTTSPVEENGPQESVSTDKSESVDDFINRMSAPRKENKGAFALDPTEEAQGDNKESITDDDAGNIEHFNYSPDHRHTALFFIGLLDSAMGWIGTFSTGLDPERYQQFAKRQPPDFYVDSAAAMVKKYHAQLSLEMMFISALAMVYGPAVGAIRSDRKMLKEKAMEEKIKSQSRSARIT